MKLQECHEKPREGSNEIASAFWPVELIEGMEHAKFRVSNLVLINDTGKKVAVVNSDDVFEVCWPA